jgi:hypothetical protein
VQKDIMQSLSLKNKNMIYLMKDKSNLENKSMVKQHKTTL